MLEVINKDIVVRGVVCKSLNVEVQGRVYGFGNNFTRDIWIARLRELEAVLSEQEAVEAWIIELRNRGRR